MGFTKAQVKALQATEGDDRKELIEAFKKTDAKPQSRAPGGETINLGSRENWLKSLRN